MIWLRLRENISHILIYSIIIRVELCIFSESEQLANICAVNKQDFMNSLLANNKNCIKSEIFFLLQMLETLSLVTWPDDWVQCSNISSSSSSHWIRFSSAASSHSSQDHLAPVSTVMFASRVSYTQHQLDKDKVVFGGWFGQLYFFKILIVSSVIKVGLRCKQWKAKDKPRILSNHHQPVQDVLPASSLVLDWLKF